MKSYRVSRENYIAVTLVFVKTNFMCMLPLQALLNINMNFAYENFYHFNIALFDKFLMWTYLF